MEGWRGGGSGGGLVTRLSLLLKKPKMPMAASLFPGHGADRHPVEAGRGPGRQAGGVRPEPPAEGAHAAAEEREGGGEEAAAAQGGAEGAARPAAARRGDGRVHPQATGHRRPDTVAAGDRQPPGGDTGTETWTGSILGISRAAPLLCLSSLLPALLLYWMVARLPPYPGHVKTTQVESTGGSAGLHSVCVAALVDLGSLPIKRALRFFSNVICATKT